MRKGRATGISAALLSSFFLGLAPVFGKAAMGMDKFTPLAVVALRTTSAALLLLLVIAIFKRQFIFIYPAGLIGCGLAGLINGIGSIFYYAGLNKLNASVAQMLYALYPFFVAFWMQLDRQVITKLTILRIVIAAFSAYLLTNGTSGNIDLTGVAFMLIGSALYALHLPINQRVLYDVPAPTVTVYTLIAMSIVVLPAYLIFDHSWPAQNTPWLPVLGLTMVTFFSRLTLFLGVKHIGGMQTALLGLGELLVAIVFSHLLLRESLTMIQWLGAIGLGLSLMLVWLEKPQHPSGVHSTGVLSWLQPHDYPRDYFDR